MALLASRTAAAAVACVLLALAASAAAAGSSHSPAPAPAIDCVSAAASLYDCLDYVSPGSTTRRPPAACCGEVKTAVASPAIVDCLCSLAGDKNLGIPIDMKRVLALPAACGASNDAFSKCNISALSPAGAPAPSTGGGSSSGGGSAASPPKAAAAGSPMTATTLVAAVAAPLLAYCYLF